MEFSKPKTFEDLPKFIITAVQPGLTDEDGYREFQLEGKFDPVLENSFEQIRDDKAPRWFWLLYGERGFLCPTLESFDKRLRTAILTCQSKVGIHRERIGISLSQSLLASLSRLDGP